MPRSRSLTALVRLPALARSEQGGVAQRYLGERTRAVASEEVPEVPPRRRTDAVRELRVTSMQRPRRDRFSRETDVPCLRLAGRWLEQNGFGIHARLREGRAGTVDRHDR